MKIEYRDSDSDVQVSSKRVSLILWNECDSVRSQRRIRVSRKCCGRKTTGLWSIEKNRRPVNATVK